jgi:hypothetical protein
MSKPEDFLVDAPAPTGNVDKPKMRAYMTARHIVSVMDDDYGVVGDGEADDTAGINAADADLTTGGILWFPKGIYYVAPPGPGNTCLSMHTSAAMWKGEGSGDYTIGPPVIIKTDVDSADVLVITDRHCPIVDGIAITNEADNATGCGIKITNSQNGRLYDVAIRGFDKNVEFNPGTTAPFSSFGWSIIDSELLAAVSYAVDAQASTNTLHISHCTLGSEAVAVRFKDSIGLTIDGQSDIEGAGNVAVEIDLSSQGDVNAKISCHFEFAGDPPTNGIIRLGNTAKVWGVDLDTCVFAGSGMLSVNCVNGSSFTHHGCSVHGSLVTGDPLIGSSGAIAGPSGIALSVGTNTTSTGTGISLPFIQKNAANEWLSFVQLIASATSVVDGNEQSSFKIQLLTGGSFQDVATLAWDANGVLNVQFAGYLTLMDGVTAPSAAAGVARLYVDGSDGDLKVRFGDGTIKTIVVDT